MPQNFGQQFGEFGSELLGTVTQFIDTIGDNFEATGNNNLALAERQQIENQIALMDASNRAARNALNMDAQKKIFTALYIIIISASFIYLGTYAWKQFKS